MTEVDIPVVAVLRTGSRAGRLEALRACVRLQLSPG